MSVVRNRGVSAGGAQVTWEPAGTWRRCGTQEGGITRHKQCKAPEESLAAGMSAPFAARCGPRPQGRSGCWGRCWLHPVSVASSARSAALSAAADWAARSGTCGKAWHRPRRVGGWQVPALCPCCRVCAVPGRRGFITASPEASQSVSPIPGSLSDRPFCFRARTTVLCARARFTPRTRTPRTPSCTRATST